MKVGLLGGSFNPVHYGHLILAETARERLGLTKVLFIPSSISPFKKEDLPLPRHRSAMVSLAVKGHPGFFVSEIELKRGGISFTIDTLRLLQKKMPGAKFYFLIGSDCLKNLLNWKEAEHLLHLCRFVVAKRPGFPLKAIPDGVQAIAIPQIDTSSQEIRRRVRLGKSIATQVPKGVEQYIRRHKLYR